MNSTIDPSVLGVAVYISLQQLSEDAYLEDTSVKWRESFNSFASLIAGQDQVSRITYVKRDLKNPHTDDRVEVTLSNNKQNIIVNIFQGKEIETKEINIIGKEEDIMNATTVAYAKLITSVLNNFTIKTIVVEKDGY